MLDGGVILLYYAETSDIALVESCAYKYPLGSFSNAAEYLFQLGQEAEVHQSVKLV